MPAAAAPRCVPAIIAHSTPTVLAFQMVSAGQEIQIGHVSSWSNPSLILFLSLPAPQMLRRSMVTVIITARTSSTLY